MKRTPMILLALGALGAAGCGGGGSSTSGNGGGEKGIPTGGGGVNGISVGNCLISEDFLVQPSQTTLDGTSPGGVVFTLTFYPSQAKADEVFKKRNPKTTARVENGIVDFRGNPSPYEGAPPAKISQKELAVIKRCIDENKTPAS
ncbi:MAG TPA: hypothetical protein VGJ77_10500 [Gaiellaceae bacterium]